MSEGAFVKVFREEMRAAARHAAVETIAWANSKGFGDVEARVRAEERVAAMTDEMVMDLLLATACD